MSEDSRIYNLTKKDKRLVIGLMSGTSGDGVDAALCRITGHGTASVVRFLGFYSMPYEDSVRNEILRLAGGESACAKDFCMMNFLLGRLFTKAALKLIDSSGVTKEEIDLIGSHGQTFWHEPFDSSYLGIEFPATFQLGEASFLAEEFNCPVVSDFRVRDFAAGGQGAPLVPYSEYIIYASKTECIALQNIGGIGNITCLKPGCDIDEVFAFDTGPGNMLIDATYARVTDGKFRYDDKGKFAAKGTPDFSFLSYLMEDLYIRKNPPKSTGREYYGRDYVNRIFDFKKKNNISDEDTVATVTYFTAETIKYAIDNFMDVKPDKLIIGGGGSMNDTLVGYIKDLLKGCAVMTNEDLGYNSNAKEAVAFAVMANETIFDSPNNVPGATGAKKQVVMGKISL